MVRYHPVSIETVPLTEDDPGNNDSADDMKNVDLSRIHYLSGPFEIETAEPGDVLLVEIMDVQPMQSSPWGFVRTSMFSMRNMLTDFL